MANDIVAFERATPAQLQKGISKARLGKVVHFPGAVMLSKKQYDELVSKPAVETLVGLTPPVNKDGTLSKRLVYIGKNSERANEIRAIQKDSDLLHKNDAYLLKGIVEYLDKDGWLSHKQISALETLELGIDENKYTVEYFPAGMDNYGSLP